MTSDRIYFWLAGSIFRAYDHRMNNCALDGPSGSEATSDAETTPAHVEAGRAR